MIGLTWSPIPTDALNNHLYIIDTFLSIGALIIVPLIIVCLKLWKSQVTINKKLKELDKKTNSGNNNPDSENSPPNGVSYSVSNNGHSHSVELMELN